MASCGARYLLAPRHTADSFAAWACRLKPQTPQPPQMKSLNECRQQQTFHQTHMVMLEQMQGNGLRRYGFAILSRQAVRSRSASARVLIPLVQRETLSTVELDNNEAAFSVTALRFDGHKDEVYLVVGTGKDVFVQPRTCSVGYLRVYRFRPDQPGLDLVHKVSSLWRGSAPIDGFLRRPKSMTFRRL